jgi:hypothetical protein
MAGRRQRDQGRDLSDRLPAGLDQNNRLPDLAADVARSTNRVIAAFGNATALVAKPTATPILTVLNIGDDPVKLESSGEPRN